MHQVVAERSLIAALEAIAAGAPDEGLTLNELLERLGDRAFGVALFMLALPSFVPVAAQIVSLPMLALAAQMAAGRDRPWLPAKLGARRIEKHSLTNMARFSRKWLGWLERLARPRLQRFTGHWGERVCGALFFVFGVSILLPLLFSNGVPATGILIASLGLIMSDGLLVVLGLTLGTVWILLLAFGLSVAAMTALSALIGFLGRLFGA